MKIKARSSKDKVLLWVFLSKMKAMTRWFSYSNIKTYRQTDLRRRGTNKYTKNMSKAGLFPKAKANSWIWGHCNLLVNSLDSIESDFLRLNLGSPQLASVWYRVSSLISWGLTFFICKMKMIIMLPGCYCYGIIETMENAVIKSINFGTQDRMSLNPSSAGY